MRNDIPNELYQALTTPGARVIYYLVFHFSGHDRYISDSAYVTSGGQTCEPLVTDWGSFVTSVALDSTVKAITIPNTELSVTIANTESTGWFCNEINLNPIENIEVDFYLTSDISNSKVLIERFIVTDPISYNESDNVVQITMVSKILSQQKFVGAIDPATNEFYPVVIGDATVVEGQPYGNQTFAKITAEIGTATTTITTDRNLSTAGFPASGTLSLGYDTCTYTGISDNNFTGVSGVSQILSNDSYICLLNNDITFAYGTGPVEIASPLYVNGEVYNYSATILKNENPVKVVFPNSLPYSIDEGIIPGEADSTVFYPDSITDYKNYDDTFQYMVGHAVYTKQYTGTSYGTRFTIYTLGEDVYNAIPDGVDNLLITVNFSCTLTGFAGDAATKKGYTAVQIRLLSTDYTSYSSSYNSNPVYVNKTETTNDKDKINPVYNTPWLQGFFVGYEKITTDSSFSSLGFQDVRMVITATWNTVAEGYPKKIYTVTTSLNIGSNTGSVNPATAIQSMISLQEPTIEIDSTSFTNAFNWFATNGYEFSGIIDGSKDYTTVIKEMLLQSRSFIYFAGNKVFIDISKNPIESTVKVLSLPETRFDKSIIIKRQPISDVTNKLILRYDYDNTNEVYSYSYQTQDNDSISKIKIHEELIDCYLVNSSTHAEDLADYYLEDRSQPKTIIEIAESYNKMNITIGDVIMVKTDFSNIVLFFGKVVRISKQYVNASSVSKFIFTIVGVLKPMTLVGYDIAETMSSEENQNSSYWGYGWNKMLWNRGRWNR